MGAATTPSVLAILVAHDGAAWLGTVLDALKAQTYDNLTIVGVDNASHDGCREMLLDRLGEDRVLIAERDLGFGAAVNMAADTALAGRADYLLLVHDDSAPAPGAVAAMVAAMEADTSLAAVGPKLVQWDDVRVLESVGMTVDITGRADSGLEFDERDQGQRDIVHDVLYVPTSCMLIRQADYEQIGRLDRRYHVFRDDLDLCWRLWLADRRVEVVPSALVRHVAGATNYLRLGQTALLGPRYFAERNTLATLLKLYGRSRLFTILPVFLLVGIAKVVGFLATRRIGDAWQTLRAWAWNLLHLRETMRLRHKVQSTRARSDAELRPLFGRVAPRLRAYTEAVTFWLTTGDREEDPAPAESARAEPTSVLRRAARFVRTNAIVLGAGVLLVAGLVLALPVLAAGSLRGGELLPWPAKGTSAFLGDYAASFHSGDGLGTAGAPSPARFLLGVLNFLSFGSRWLAPRVLLLGALPLAWITALIALRRVTPRRVPQVVAATLYVLSPPAIAAVRTGRISALVVVALLPALVATMTAMVRPATRGPLAWRAMAAGALIAATMVAFAPPMAAVLVPATVAMLLSLPWVLRDLEARRSARLRLFAFLIGILLLLFPWSLDLLRQGSPVWNATTPTGASQQPFWRLVLLVPEMEGFPSLLAGGGYLSAGILGLVLGLRTRTSMVVGLWGSALTATLVAWLMGRAGTSAAVWPGLPMVIAAACFAALFAVAFSEAGASLGPHAIGWRHVLAAVSVLAVAAGGVVMLQHMSTDPWDNFARDDPALPAFIASERATLGDFRVLVLSTDGGDVRWDLTGPAGPTMLRFGQPLPETLAARIDRDVTDMMGGADPGAAARLGLANVRWIVVPPRGVSEELDSALSQQLDLDQQPVRSGRVYLVSGWLPRAAFVPRNVMDSVVNQRALPPGAPIEALDVQGNMVRMGGSEPGTILLAEATEGRWRGSVDQADVDVTDLDGLVRLDLPNGAASSVQLWHAQRPRTALMAVQLASLLLGISLVLRPPGFAEERARAKL